MVGKSRWFASPCSLALPAGISRLLSLVVVLLGLVGCAVPIAGGLDETDANRVVVALDLAGIDATKEADPATDGHFRVLVPHDDASRALAAMADEQLPRPKSRGLLDADRGQLVPSQATEHAQLVAGLAGELERTLGGLEGVLSARVHLNVPVRDGLRDGPPAKATGSVLVEHRGATPPLTTESVQRLVAGGAPGLAPADVVVVFVPRAPRSASSRPDLAHVGPISVARGSMTTLKALFVSIAIVVLALAAATLALFAKVAKLRRDQNEGMHDGRSVPQRVPAPMAPVGVRPGLGPHP